MRMVTIARVTFAVLALTAMGRQLALHLGASFSAINFFSYFTNLSNLFAAFALILGVLPGRETPRDLIRYVSAVNMTVVGLVFAVLLRTADLGALLPWVNCVLHYVMPVAVVVDWLVNRSASKLSPKNMLLVLIFPAAYLAYVIVRGAGTGWYPYPFLDPAKVGGYGGVAAYSLGIAATFILAAWALRAGGNRLAAPRTHATGT